MATNFAATPMQTTLMRHFDLTHGEPSTANEWAKLTGDVLRTFALREGKPLSQVEESVGIERGSLILMQNGISTGVITAEHWYKVLEYYGLAKIRDILPEISPNNPKLLMFLCIKEIYKDGMEGMENKARRLFTNVIDLANNLRDIGEGKEIDNLHILLMDLFGVNSRKQDEYDAIDWVGYMYTKITGKTPFSDQFIGDDDEDEEDLN